MLGQGHHFGDDQGIARHNHLITRLGDLPCAHRPHVRHPLAQGQQDRPCPLYIGALPSDHDRQGAGLGPRGPTGNRRIEPLHATAKCQFSRHFTSGGRLQARQIDQQLPGTRPFDNPLCTEHHLAYHGRIGQAQQHHIGGLAQFGRA
ncbi:hypothetical protein D3C76_1084060 [compost metagenome]